MSIPMTLDVTLTRSDGVPVTLYRTPAGRQDGPTPVGAISITSGRPSPRDHADPGEITLVVDVPAGHPVEIDYDGEIVVTGTLTGPPAVPVTLSRCWVQSWHRDHLGEVDRYTITAHDVIGRAAGWNVGDRPWPQESANSRVGRLRSLAPGTIRPVLWPLSGVAARDVDNRSVLELLALCTDPDAILVPTVAGIDWQRPGHRIHYNTNDNYLWVDESRPEPVNLPSRCVEDTGVDLSRASRLSRISIEYPPSADLSATSTLNINGRADVISPPAAHRVTTDIIDAGPNYENSLRGILAGPDMLHPGQVREDVLLPSPTRLMLDRERMAPATWGALLDEGTRLTTPLYIDGPIRRGDYPRLHFITSVTIVVDGRHGLTRYDVTLTPGDVAGVRRLRWRDWRRYYDAPRPPGSYVTNTYTFKQLQGAGDLGLKFSHTRLIRLKA